MAFFKKLKERLFNSSSKIDEGLEAIVGDGGEEEVIEAQADAQDTAAREARDAEAREVEDAARAEAENQRRAAETERAARDAAAEAERVEAGRAAAIKAQQEAAEELRRAAATAAEGEAAETARKAAEQATAEAAAAQAAREAAQKSAAEQAARDAEVRAAAEQQAREHKAREDAENAARAKLAATMAPVAPSLEAVTPVAPSKPSLLGRLIGRSAAAKPDTVVRRVLDDEMLEQLEELLISADMGVDTALRVTANMAEGRFGRKLSVAEIKELMAQEIARIMEPVAKPLPLYAKTPQVVLVVGVNGSGKTTTIGKLASQFKAAGKQVVIAAGDTFRAAAVEQLQVWGERAGVPVLTAAQGSDPASLAFDAMARAEADGADLLLIDTAGRLQNRGDLMEELAKIVRVIRKKDPSAPHNTLLVLDATTGQNALNQVKVFQEISDVSGLVMTKLDGTAKGGVLVALADKFGLPIHAIGVGEQIDDLSPFDPQEFADALVGVSRE
ncbi:signal recognition particle-docking protein FtsY [Sulfitobacter brevis]|uniref:Signal recognition particle receptor FtsY n=1 Tax=Sulfitobacter brevis TaxID=74348 RepID=A0A1I1Z652_9RHOB|nr:signal recognition particle-docking protein FtsY [Sulfitobacter brevis]SFE25963.1 signal recognition particle-docking protein FtsY [Sulfitobacter brevis]